MKQRADRAWCLEGCLCTHVCRQPRVALHPCWLMAFSASQTDDKTSLHNLSWQIHNLTWKGATQLVFPTILLYAVPKSRCRNNSVKFSRYKLRYKHTPEWFIYLSIWWIWCGLTEKIKKKKTERRESAWDNMKDTLRVWLFVSCFLPGRIARFLFAP